MVSKLRALLVIALCLPLVGAWPNTGKKYPPPAAGGCSNSPGDVVSGATAWWGLRAYSKSICTTGTQAAVNLERSSDSHTCDVLVASTGLGNTANCSTGGDNGQSAASFCNATTCSVTKLYDQTTGNNCTSASCDVAQATAADQPTITFNGLGSLPVITSNGSTQFLTSANGFSGSQPITIEAMAESTKTSQGTIVSIGNGNLQLGFHNSGANTAFIYAGNVASETANDSAAHALVGVLDTTTSALNVDGTDFTGLSVGTATSTQGIVYSSDNGNPTNPFKGFSGEGGFWSSAFSSGQRSSMCHNIFTFWGTVTSC